MGDEPIKIVCYADDAVLISENENEQRLLYRFQLSAEKWNMTISVQKTQSLVIARNPVRCKLATYNRSIEQIMSFRYLEVNIISDRKPYRGSQRTDDEGGCGVWMSERESGGTSA